MTSPIGERGLTLIEVLVAVAILASSAVGVLQALGTVAHALALGEQRLSAYEFAASKMEELKLEALQIQSSDPDPLKPLNTHGSFRLGMQPFRWEVTSQAVSADSGLGSMTLTVGWIRGAQEYENRFSTLFRLPVEEEKS